MYELLEASEHDLPWLFELHKAALGDYVAELWGWDDGWQRRHFQDTTDLLNSRIILVGGERAGRLTVEEGDDYLALSYLALFPRWQNRGVGTEVVTDVLQRARSKGKAVKLSVLRSNPALRLYERLGFVVTERDAYRVKMLWRPTA